MYVIWEILSEIGVGRHKRAQNVEIKDFEVIFHGGVEYHFVIFHPHGISLCYIPPPPHGISPHFFLF